MSNQPPQFFAYDKHRAIQQEMIEAIAEEVGKKQSIVIHAPTGLGKTAASFAPILHQALTENKKILFLTSRNTQHHIAIETLKAIKTRFDIDLRATDVIGKKWMCIQPGVQMLSSNEFGEYCKAMREDKQCAYFERLKNGERPSPKTLQAMQELKIKGTLHAEEIVDAGAEHELCPYELAMMFSKESHVIVSDYYYMFHPHVRETFLQKNELTLQECIVIVDEAHNLPNRIKSLSSAQLGTNVIRRAIKEAKKLNHSDLSIIFEKLYVQFQKLLNQGESERHTTKEEFLTFVGRNTDYDEFRKECHKFGKLIREEQKSSAIGSIGTFLDEWLGDDDGFTRIIHRKRRGADEQIIVSYRCLDPSIVAKPLFSQTYASILMSGTLTPTSMYAEVLGFPASIRQEEFPSPFPEENRLNLIVAKTSTKFTARSESQYKEIGKVITEIANATPGNSAVFFPSYSFKEKVYTYLEDVKKTVFNELQGLTGAEKQDLIDGFRSYKKTGAVLLGVGAGSFGEGIDLPGDELKTVIIVGLPLSRPDLETKALISYYDKKFNKGWDYGYVFPAFNKIIQNAGRCIRSSEDRGVVVFLDERFTWNQYYRCFPETWKLKVNINYYADQVAKFFAEDGK